MENKNHVNAKTISLLRKNIATLAAKCFSDVPLLSQQILQALTMKSSRSAYIKGNPNETNIGEKYFPQESIQTKTAQKITDRVFKKMLRGKTAASEQLRQFVIKNKIRKIKVLLTPQQSLDGGTGTFDKNNKTISIILTAGIFHQPESNEDILAAIIGHELGHFLADAANNNTNLNAREVESFCDWYGHALTASAGYTPQGIGNIYAKFAPISKPSAPDNPHPHLADRAFLAEMVAKSYGCEKRECTPFPNEVYQINWIPDKEFTQPFTKPHER